MSVTEEKTNNTKDQSSNKGFISTSFLIVLLMMMNLIFNKIDYIISANTIYNRFRQSQDSFYKQALIIEKAKCMLLQDDNLENFYVDGCFVSVYSYGNRYGLYFDNYCIEIDVYERQIISMKMYSV